MRCCSKKVEEAKTGRCGHHSKTLFVGMLAGLVLGLLFAPKPGQETMADLKEKVLGKLPV